MSVVELVRGSLPLHMRRRCSSAECRHFADRALRYFPDFYAPLASDLIDLPSYDIRLEMGTPFPPLAQLLSVLPPQSGSLLPGPYAELMQSNTSPIYDAFPVDFTLDANGKVRAYHSTVTCVRGLKASLGG